MSVVSDVLGLSIIFRARVERIPDVQKACVGRACSVCQRVSDAPLTFEKRTSFLGKMRRVLDVLVTCSGRVLGVFLAFL